MGLLIISFCSSAVAGDVHLAWDASISPGVTNYQVYVGSSSRSYGVLIKIGNQSAYTVSGLKPGTYFFAVTAMDAAGNESDFSNEVSTTIAGPVEFKITSQTAQMNWYGVVLLATTNTKATAILRYQKVEPNAGWTTIVASQTPRTEHRAIIYMGKFKPSVYWRYEWTITDDKGNKVTGGSTFLR